MEKIGNNIDYLTFTILRVRSTFLIDEYYKKMYSKLYFIKNLKHMRFINVKWENSISVSLS